tara:strand:+ start:199 stop:414 length:216 start_codon:yes stop_codon:yes gene_type:complete
MNKFKVGDLVKVCSRNYPRYKKKGTCGILMRESTRESTAQSWSVFISGRMHPYTIDEIYIDLLEKWVENEE